MISNTTAETSKTSVWRLNVVERCVISTYERDHSQSSAMLANISPILCGDLLAQAMNERYRVAAFQVTPSAHGLSAETLAKNWNIPMERAKRTLAVTTQRGIRSRPNPMVQRFKTNDRMFRYNWLTSNMFTDTLESGLKSVQQNKYAQIFVVPPNWTKAYAMKRKGDAHHCLSSLFHDIGVPEKMVMDGAKEQVQGEFRRKLKDAGCHVHVTEPHTPWSDRAELAIRELKRKT
ncbi:hypothetical protein IV203_027685 [Nitzschia inconspicua]|uniref:Uncharacterized protein n=1 Tax=Nitzschia inconspicua TaxID=303405 RepID=A0A9K3LWV6_9STRA|nr:hypothetical protein IV203_027681 [Nitzschia inconspicua]KAG7369939.1 hypothetical protein IV203_027685 [Nitzschia inconspicua]